MYARWWKQRDEGWLQLRREVMKMFKQIFCSAGTIFRSSVRRCVHDIGEQVSQICSRPYPIRLWITDLIFFLLVVE